MDDLAPYFQGYLSAARSDAHMVNGWSLCNMPQPIYPPFSKADDAWAQGVSDRVDDRVLALRRPAWRLI